MKKILVKLELKDKDDHELVSYVDNHIAAMAGNAKFTTPDPDAAAFLVLRNNFKADLDASDLADQDAKTKTGTKNVSRELLEAGVTTRGGYVQKTAVTEADVLSSYFSVRDDTSPIGALPAPQHLTATGGDMPGEVDLHNDPVKGRETYIGEYADSAAGPWTQFYIGRKSSCTATGLVSGQNYFFRLCANGPLGRGPWSDLAEKRAT